MIYKIPFKDVQPLQEIMQKIGDIGEFIYSDKVIFLHTDYDIPSIMKFIGTADGTCVEIINSNNYSQESSSFVSDWCFNKLLKDKVKDFEESEEGQKKIKQLMDYLDTLEKIKKEGVKEDAAQKKQTDSSE